MTPARQTIFSWTAKRPRRGIAKKGNSEEGDREKDKEGAGYKGSLFWHGSASS